MRFAEKSNDHMEQSRGEKAEIFGGIKRRFEEDCKSGMVLTNMVMVTGNGIKRCQVPIFGTSRFFSGFLSFLVKSYFFTKKWYI